MRATASETPQINKPQKINILHPLLLWPSPIHNGLCFQEENLLFHSCFASIHAPLFTAVREKRKIKLQSKRDGTASVCSIAVFWHSTVLTFWWAPIPGPQGLSNYRLRKQGGTPPLHAIFVYSWQ
ncbi:hypothetical protein TNIN_10251 [Trichonephila inaurata madagascariensis]|uniref:Uncharacterized protein n=1 Tax=Trichonephila inaurata madagascariensis TaxID=2747483 RepID=A0A8X6YSL5_9ARAC|nr:hypothetical protein TNIN_10251 [Trichonephila inaurata madagascariensis]